MSEWSAMIDEEWDNLKPYLVGSFTTQIFQGIFEEIAPKKWKKIIAKYGPGGEGSGNFYSPNNILYNYLKYKSKKNEVIEYSLVPSLPGWGSHLVKLWSLSSETIAPSEEEVKYFLEGKKYFRIHLAHERAPGLRNTVLASRSKIGLSCDMCGTNGAKIDEDLRDSIFEVHHKTPISETGETTTTVEDVGLLCACCHRLIHRLMDVRDPRITIEEARDILAFDI